MNYGSLCKRLAICTALGIALALPAGAVWTAVQPEAVVYAAEYSSLRGNIIENAYLLVGTPFKMGGSSPSEEQIDAAFAFRNTIEDKNSDNHYPDKQLYGGL